MRMVEKWEMRMKKAGHEFAMIKTNNAVFDRVAVGDDLPTILVVQYPKRSSKNKNLNSAHSPGKDFTIKQESISKRDIVDIRYYKD